MRHEGKGEELNGEADTESCVEESPHHSCRHIATAHWTSGLDRGDLCKVDARADVCQAHCTHLEEAGSQQHWEVGSKKDGNVAEHGAKVAGHKHPLSSKPLTEGDAEEDAKVHGNGRYCDKPGALQLGKVQERGGGVCVVGQDQSSISEAGAGGHPVEEDDAGGEDEEGGGGVLLGREHICWKRHLSGHTDREAGAFVILVCTYIVLVR